MEGCSWGTAGSMEAYCKGEGEGREKEELGSRNQLGAAAAGLLTLVPGKYIVPKVLDFSPRHKQVLQREGQNGKPSSTYMPYSQSKTNILAGAPRKGGVLRQVQRVSTSDAFIDKKKTYALIN